MSYKVDARVIISKLLHDPVSFTKTGAAYQLLQCYFQGTSIATLKPLLESKDANVRKSAIFVVSELGGQAQELVAQVVPLARDSDPSIRWDALESIMLCTTSANHSEFVHIIEALDDLNPSVRQLAMRLASRATPLQIQGATDSSGRLPRSPEIHKRGLISVTRSQTDELAQMVESDIALTRKYGVIGATRLLIGRMEILARGCQSSDCDINDYCNGLFEPPDPTGLLG